MQSSIIRGGIADGANNLDLMKIFDGVSEKLSNVKVGKVTGEELLFIVLENVKENIENKKRNTIIQWSDIQISRSNIEKIFLEKGKVEESDIKDIPILYSKFIFSRNKEISLLVVLSCFIL